MTHWLLLRGLAREQRHFGAFPDAFAAATNAHVTTIDLPGFGTEAHRASPTTVGAIVDDVRARFRASTAHAIEPGSPVGIFAISLGGMVALDWAARYADDFARVVVANASAADLSPPWHRFSTSMMTRLPVLVRAPPLERERTILAITSNRSERDNAALAVAWARFYDERTPRRSSFARQLFAATRSRAPRAIKAPVLVLTSTADRLVDHRCSRAIAARLRAPLRVHGEGGHDITLDAPTWVCEQVAA